MKIHRLEVGYLSENCYILEVNNNILIIDPGSEYERINNYLRNKRLLGILITHNHFDHIGALKDIKNNYDVKIYNKDNLLEKEYNIGPFIFEAIYTPGHTTEEITYYFKKENIMFTGDFIFRDGIGRCDLDDGNYLDMLDSIKKIKKYDRSIKIYPGHGMDSILGVELDKYL